MAKGITKGYTRKSSKPGGKTTWVSPKQRTAKQITASRRKK